VGTDEREPGLLTVIECCLAPHGRSMASTTLDTETSRVDIVAPVTVRARFRQLAFSRGLTMAACAARRFVRAHERESARLRMIEILFDPGLGSVTARAVRSEFACVSVIDSMAGNATLGRVLVLLSDMAPLAARDPMNPGQWIVRRRMIESSFSPCALVVTLTAIFRERASVGVVFSVARDAVARRIASRDIGRMTICAAGTLMTAQQGIVGLHMIEDRFTHAADIRISPEMIGMAASALTRGGQGIPAVKSLALSQVVRNELVA